MMDFELAADRLAEDHSKLRSKRRTRGLKVSNREKQEAERRKRQLEVKKERLVLERKKQQVGQLLMEQCQLSSSSSSFQATFDSCTSIHGPGDKIALPPSILQELSTKDLLNNDSSSPLYFRVGIRNPHYNFPASPSMKAYMEEFTQTRSNTSNAATIDQDDEDAEDDEDEAINRMKYSIYLEELSYQYYTYTHATVVEFTQEEGHIGLPKSIASALLDPSRLSCHRKLSSLSMDHPSPIQLPHTRTVDPAASYNDTNDDNTNDSMETEGTPGHVAYGAFDVPANMPVQITLLSKLPKGKQCILKPTKEAIDNGFYQLKDIKLVLEQSLIRTRATLSIGDEISTWHRGKQYNLSVTSLQPDTYAVVSCINTDLEVEFSSSSENTNTDKDTQNTKNNDNQKNQSLETNSHTAGNQGYRLKDYNTNMNDAEIGQQNNHTLSSSSTALKGNDQNGDASISATTKEQRMMLELPDEPALTQLQGVCTIQLRSFDGTSTQKRRFDLKKHTIQQVFDYASNHCALSQDQFRLVTRFPRQVFHPSDQTLQQCQFGKQELLLIERV